LLFQEGRCANCHGGQGWTLSRRFFTPSSATILALTTTAFTGAANLLGGSKHTVEIAAEPNPAGGSVAPAQVACVLRDVKTYGVPGDAAATTAVEVKANNTKAQGEFTGYNIPSLYGLQVGAPFLHHGQVKTLPELFTDDKWKDHRLAANSVFNSGNALSTTQALNLANFLWSIDAAKAEIAPDNSILPRDACRANFP
jgi:hypothetical protein